MIFRIQDRATGYKPGLWACFTCSVMNIVLVGMLTLKFTRDNKLAREGKLKIEDSEVSELFVLSFLFSVTIQTVLLT